MAKLDRPNLLVIGAMKSSTSLFHEILGAHPDVWFPETKEPHYFSDRAAYESESEWRRYLRLFHACPESARYTGEASTTYTTRPHCGDVPARIRERLGRPKLVYLLRDPVARAVSHFRHSAIAGAYPPGTSLGDAVDRDPILVDTSRYDHQLEAYEQVFGPGSVLVLIAETFQASPRRTMQEVERALDLEPFDGWPDTLPHLNTQSQLDEAFRGVRAIRRIVGKGRFSLRVTDAAARIAPRWAKAVVKSWLRSAPAMPDVTPADRARVRTLLADDFERLRARLGERLDVWPSAAPEPLSA